MILLEEQKKRIRELYAKHGLDGSASYEEFRRNYKQISPVDFFEYWRRCKSGFKQTKTRTLIKRTLESSYCLSIDPCVIR